MIDYFHTSLNLKKYSKATIAINYDKTTGNVNIGLAVCSNKDRYNRKKGNLIALGRSDSKHKITFNIPQNLRRGEVKKQVLEELLRSYGSYEELVKTFLNSRVNNGQNTVRF